MKRRLIPVLITLIIASLACDFELMPTPLPTAVPLPTLTATVTPSPTLTPTPTITPTPPLTASNGPALLELHMFDTKRGWGLIEDAILSTTDGAVHWASVPLPGAKVDASMGAFFVTADIAYFVVPVPEARFGQFFATRDGGQTWEINPVPFSTAQLYFVDDNVGFAFQTLSKTADTMTVGIYQTGNRGASWEQVFVHTASQGDTNLPAAGIKTGISFINPSDGFIGMFSQQNSVGLFHAPDAGRTWTKPALEPPSGLGDYTSTAWPPFFFKGNYTDGFAPVDYVAAGTDALTRIFYVTHDSGATWTAGGAVQDGTVYDFLDPQTGWVWGGHTLYFTADGAQTWAQLPVAFNRSEHATIIDFVDIKNGWLVTVEEPRNRLHIYRTGDGGATWTVIIL